MKRGIVVAVACAALTGGLAGAHAEEADPGVAGRFGVGVNRTLGGAQGISGQFQVSEALGFQGVLGLQYLSIDVGDDSVSATQFVLGAHVIYALARAARGAVGIVGGLNLGVNTGLGDADGPTHFLLDAGLRGDLFITPWLSINVEIGLVFNLVPEEGAVFNPEGQSLAGADGTEISIGNTGLTGAGGVIFWF